MISVADIDEYVDKNIKENQDRKDACKYLDSLYVTILAFIAKGQIENPPECAKAVLRAKRLFETKFK